MKKIKYLILSLFMVIGLMGLTNTEAMASEKSSSRVYAENCDSAYSPYMSLDSTILLNESIYPGSSIGGFPTKNYKITKVTSSNKKVAKYYKPYSDSSSFSLKLVGVGKTKITVDVTYKKKTYKISRMIEVVDDKPFKSIKYDKKEIYKGNEYKTGNVYKAKSGKVLEWKLNKGYKIISASLNRDNKFKKIKSGSKIVLKNVEHAFVYFYIETPDKKYIYYHVNFFK